MNFKRWFKAFATIRKGASVVRKLSNSKLVRVLFAIMGLVIVALAFAAANAITSTATNLTEKESLLTWLSKGFALLLLIVICAFIVQRAFKECKKGDPPRFDWGGAKENLVLIALPTVFIANILANLFAHGIWGWFWDRQLLFWGTNLGIIVIAHFLGKPNWANHFAAGLFGFLILVGFLTALIEHSRMGGLTPKEYKKKVVAEKKMAKEPILEAIAACRPDKEFDTAEKIEAASQRYREHGVESWMSDYRCWETKIPRGISFTLAVVEATDQNWSRSIPLPQMGMRNFWDNPAGEISPYRTLVNGKLEILDGETGEQAYDRLGVPRDQREGARSVQFKAMSGTAKIVVTKRPRDGS